MDLSRWGFERLSQITRLSDGYNNLREFLADVLEGERSLLSHQSREAESLTDANLAKTRKFLVNSQVTESLLKHQSPRTRSTLSNAKSIFSQLAPCFEAGLLVSRSGDGRARIHSMFIFGEVFCPNSPEDASLNIQLPRVGLSGVRTARATEVLRAMGLSRIASLQSASAFVFEASSEFLFLLICDRPHPWQVGALEAAYIGVKELMSESTAEVAKARK